MITDLSPLDLGGFTSVAETTDGEYDAALWRWAEQDQDVDPRGLEGNTEGMRLVGLLDTVYRYADGATCWLTSRSPAPSATACCIRWNCIR